MKGRGEALKREPFGPKAVVSVRLTEVRAIFFSSSWSLGAAALRVVDALGPAPATNFRGGLLLLAAPAATFGKVGDFSSSILLLSDVLLFFL